MNRSSPEVFTAPLFLGTAFLLVGLAIVEKALNIIGTSLPMVDVFPRQLLDWAVTLMILEIALTLRQMLDRGLGVNSGPESELPSGPRT